MHFSMMHPSSVTPPELTSDMKHLLDTLEHFWGFFGDSIPDTLIWSSTLFPQGPLTCLLWLSELRSNCSAGHQVWHGLRGLSSMGVSQRWSFALSERHVHHYKAGDAALDQLGVTLPPGFLTFSPSLFLSCSPGCIVTMQVSRVHCFLSLCPHPLSGVHTTIFSRL